MWWCERKEKWCLNAPDTVKSGKVLDVQRTAETIIILGIGMVMEASVIVMMADANMF